MAVLSNTMMQGSSAFEEAADDYQIEKSLRFNSADTPKLSRTFSLGNIRTLTWSGWVKRNKFGTQQSIFGAPDTGNTTDIEFDTSDRLIFTDGGSIYAQTTAVFRDPSAWYHIVFALNASAGTLAERCKLYVNGELQDVTTQNYGQHGTTDFGTAGVHTIGSSKDVYSDTMLADVHYIDGLALNPSAFGSFDSTGVWNPKAFALPAPNTNKTWNSNTSGGSVHGSYPMTQSFDGNTTTAGVRAVSGGGFVWQPTGGLAYTTSIEVHSGVSGVGTQQCKINDGAAVNVAENVWVTVETGSGTLTKLEMTAGATGNANIYLGAVRVDGVVLVDGKTDPTTRVNPNNGVTWSDYLTSDASGGTDGFWGNGPGHGHWKTYSFDGKYSSTGNDNTEAATADDDKTLTFSPPGGLAYSHLIEVFVYDQEQEITLNGTQEVSSSNTGIWTTVKTGSGTITTMTFHPVDSGDAGRFSAIRVDGHVLVDDTDDNSFQLKFNDTSLNRYLGKDTLNGKIADATGGLPIYNTTDDYGDVKGSGYRADSSAGTTDGTGLVLAMPGDTLTDLHASINTGSSNNSFTTVGTVATTTDQSRFYGTSMDFGTADGNYLKTTSANSDFALGTGAFTIEAWYYLNSDGGWDQGILQLSNAEGVGTYNQSGGISIYTGVGSGGTINLIVGNATYASFGSHNGFNKGWHHFAGTRDSSGVCRVFVDGVLGNVTNTSAHDITATYLNVGAYGSTSYSWHGMLNDIRIYKGVCKYNTNFTPPTRNDFTVTNLITNLSSNPEMKYFKFRSTYNSTGYSCAYSVEYSDNNTSWTEAWNGIASTAGGACQLIQGTNGGGSYGTHRYWRFKCGATNNSTAFPRVSRLVLVDAAGTDHELIKFVDDNCSDSGTIPTDGTTYSRDFIGGNAGDGSTDSPTNYGEDTGIGGEVRGNYATWNPLHESHPGKMEASDGNLTSKQKANWGGGLMATMGAKTGKWYYELTAVDETNSRPVFGIVPVQYGAQLPGEGGANSVGYRGTGVKRINTSGGNEQSYGDAWEDGDIIGVALDCDNGAVYFSRNGTWQASGVPTSGASRTNACHTWTAGSEYMIPSIAEESASTSIINFGQRKFKYTAPSGYKCLCTQNLADTFTGDNINNPSKFFDIATWTATGSNIEIAGIGFQPDLVWAKCKSDGSTPFLAVDAVRGVSQALHTHGSSAEEDYSSNNGVISAFNSDGFDTGSNSDIATSGRTYVSWLWDAGTAASGANNDGSINIASGDQWVNATAGFSITKLTGSSSNNTFGHGLSAPPEFIIAKSYDENIDYRVYHVSVGPDYGGLLLNENDGQGNTDSEYWGTGMTNDIITLKSGGSGGNNRDGENMIYYAWTPIAGYSSFGSYSDDVFVYTGFKPKWLLIKAKDATQDWWTFDTQRDSTNPNTDVLIVNLADGESTDSSGIDFLSNGFKVQSTTNEIGSSSYNYIYAAFAEHPFKTSRAR